MNNLFVISNEECRKIELLTNYHNDKIKKGLEEVNGSESESKD